MSEFSFDTDVVIARKLINMHDSATKREIEFNLSFKRLKRLVRTKKCFYTNIPLNFIRYDEHQLTIDRVDNNIGYVDGNVVACSRKFNEIKGEITVDSIKIISKVFQKRGLL